jgi:FtsP/CotA-like multicopper oxidase with cupredoxin domain
MELTRRRFTHLTAMTSASLGLGRGLTAQMRMPAGQPTPSAPPIPANAPPADFTLDIAPYLVEPSPKHRYQTLAYNGQVPGPLLRMKQGRPIVIDIHNHSPEPDIVHWHGLFLPIATDGAMEEGSPMIAPGASTRIAFTPDPAGFRWFHTHTFAGSDLRKAQYGGQHGFLMIESSNTTGQPIFDREIFLALHDWGGSMMPSGDGSAMPMYEVSTINGKMLGFGEPIRVKQGERVMMHILNSSPTEVHWVALARHTLQVVALDGNPVARAQTVDMLRLAPAERVSAIVQMNSPGVWVLGEVRKHVQAAGMGIVVEYANATGTPKWIQPENLAWDYKNFAWTADTNVIPPQPEEVIDIPLVFDSKFEGHGSPEIWRINGKSYPDTESPTLQQGKRYRLVMKNLSTDAHPIHLHRHTFEVTNVGGTTMRGLMKDVLLIPAQKTSEVEFIADHPGNTLFHCHQQDHMDRGFMMVFHYV